MAIIANIKEFKSYIGGVQLNMDFLTWNPFIDDAIDGFIVPAIGADLVTVVSNVTVDSHAILIDLKKKIAKATAWYAYFKAIPQMTVITGDAGMTQPSNASQTVMPKWMMMELLKSTLKNAENAIEDVLNFIDKNIEAKTADGVYVLAAWIESDIYLESATCFIGSARELTESFPAAKNSRRLFYAIRGYIKQCQGDFIRSLLGAEFYKVLLIKNSEAEPEFSLQENEVLRLLRIALANAGFVKCLPFVGFSEDFRMVSTTDGFFNEDLADNNKLTAMKRVCEIERDRAAAQLKAYLNEKASSTVFAEYFSSEVYEKKEVVEQRGSRVEDRFRDTSKPFVIL